METYPFIPRTGVDLVAIDRMAALLARHGDRFLARAFTAGEVAHCSGRANAAARYAARFAAKEAVMKLLGEGIWQLPLTDIEVVGGGDSRPSIRLHGRAREIAGRLRLGPIDLSLSHDGGHAIASCVALAGVGQ